MIESQPVHHDNPPMFYNFCHDQTLRTKVHSHYTFCSRTLIFGHNRNKIQSIFFQMSLKADDQRPSSDSFLCKIGHWLFFVGTCALGFGLTQMLCKYFKRIWRFLGQVSGCRNPLYAKLHYNFISVTH